MSKLKLILTISLIFTLNSIIVCQLMLKTIIVNGKVKNFTDTSKIQLNEAETDLLVEFSDQNPSKVGYEYILAKRGEKEIWQKVSYPTAHFLDFGYGNFIFKIRAQDSKNRAEVQLEIQKKMAFYQEWWFWPIIAFNILAIIGVLIYLFFLYDFRQKLKMQHVRNQIAADLHDEVGSNLNSIAIFTEVLRKTADKNTLPIIDRITTNSKESVSLMQDTVWMINPKNDSTEKLLERMKSFASSVLASKNISLDFILPEGIEKLKFNMDQRKNCYLIFKEAINNIVKHADASKVVVNISPNKNGVGISIEDNGKGFNINDIHDGNGLQNFKERAEEAEFELKIDSEINKGTLVEMHIIMD